VYSLHNAGDLAILRKRLICCSFVDADITVAINDLRRDLVGSPGATVDLFSALVISIDGAGERRWREAHGIAVRTVVVAGRVLFTWFGYDSDQARPHDAA